MLWHDSLRQVCKRRSIPGAGHSEQGPVYAICYLKDAQSSRLTLIGHFIDVKPKKKNHGTQWVQGAKEREMLYWIPTVRGFGLRTRPISFSTAPTSEILSQASSGRNPKK